MRNSKRGRREDEVQTFTECVAMVNPMSLISVNGPVFLEGSSGRGTTKKP